MQGKQFHPGRQGKAQVSKESGELQSRPVLLPNNGSNTDFYFHHRRLFKMDFLEDLFAEMTKINRSNDLSFLIKLNNDNPGFISTG
jgi:hypothetical protein